VKHNIDYSLYLVTNREMCEGRNFLEIISEAIRGGVTVVQLREKSMDTCEFLRNALSIKKLLSLSDIPLIINDRIDIALAASADGVHIGQNDMPLEIARRILGDDFIIGVSVNDIDSAVAAEKGGADYIAVSPIWSTPTKTDTPHEIGLSMTAKIVNAVKIPVVGIGNIKYNNCAKVLETGCAGIAVVSAIMAAENPYLASTELKKAIKGYI